MKAVRLVLGVTLAALIVMLTMSAFPAQAGDPPLFQPGQAYVFVWDCVPQWEASLAAAQVGQPLSPCYMELLTVNVVRKDGWLMVTDTNDGSTWTVNPARASSIQPYRERPATPTTAPVRAPTRAAL